MLKIAKNAASNVARGGASALVALVVPYFLVRLLSAADYGAWVLALQLSAYVSYFDFGVQTAIARFVAQSRQSKSHRRCSEILSSTGLILCITMLCALTGLVLLIVALPIIYRGVAAAEISNLRICMMLVGGSLIIGLPASALTGVLVGYERNEIPALAIGSCRLAAGAIVILTARHSQSLGYFAAVTSGFNLLSYAIQFVAVRKLLPSIRVSTALIDWRFVREFIAYCVSLSSCSLGMFLVSGLDLAIVGHFRFGEIVPYSMAATLVTFVAGINGNVFNSLLAPAAMYHINGERRRLGDLVLYATRAAVLLNVFVGIPLVILAKPLLRFWVGEGYAATTAPILQILVAANVIRLVFNPFFVAVLGTGEQGRLIISPVLEGVVNVAASVLGAKLLGGVGVACGTLIGAIFGFIWAYFYNLPRAQEIHMDRGGFLRESLLKPALCFLPVAALFPVFGHISTAPVWLPLSGGLGLSILAIVRWGGLRTSRSWAS